MGEVLLAERILSFSLSLVITFVIAVIHGFLLARDSKFSWLIPLSTLSLSIGLMLGEGWTNYSKSFTSKYTPYITAGSITGAFLGYYIGWKIGKST